MSKRAFEGIKAGLKEAIAYVNGDTAGSKTHRISVPDVDVRAVREKLNMTQGAFAETFQVPRATVCNWEQGRRRPEGPAMVLLNIIDREPAAVRRALGEARASYTAGVEPKRLRRKRVVGAARRVMASSDSVFRKLAK